MTRDISWTIDGIEADGLVGQTPTLTRAETITLAFIFRRSTGSGQDYDDLREYLEWASERSIRLGTTDTGVPWVRERLPSRASVDSLIVPVETGADVEDIDGLWGAIVSGEDQSEPPSDIRRVTIDVSILADIDEYATREELLADLGSEVI